MVRKKLTGYLMLLTLFTGVIFTPVNSYGQEATQSVEDIVLISDTEENRPVSDMVAGDDEKAPAKEVGSADMMPVYGTDVADGTYEIEVESSSSMFRIVKAELTVKDGEMTAVLTLGGKGYLRLYMGTGEQALAADADAYAEYQEDADGAYTYEVPVEALNKELECTGFSKRKEKWYDHQICFDAATLPEGAVLIPLEAETQATEETLPEEETEPTETAVLLAQEEIDQPDGTYQVTVDLAGGSGRATIESPAVLTIEGKKAIATIVWSSPNYDYMLVNGEKYLPVNTEGNSTFEIPVLCFDKEMPVVADTVAMSTPHEIEYTLTFHTDSIKGEAKSGAVPVIVVVVVAACVAAGTVLICVKKRKNNAK